MINNTAQKRGHKLKSKKIATSRITKETRRASNIITEKQPLQDLIYDILKNGPLTAREVANEMYKKGLLQYPARAVIQPRITELVKAGRIAAVRDKMDDMTKRKVAVYKVIESEGENEINNTN